MTLRRGRARLRVRRASGEPSPRDAGFSYVEIVACITMMAILVVPLMATVQTSIRASATVQQVAQAETVLQNAADRVNRAPKVCDYTVYVQAAAQTAGWPAGQATAVHTHYVPGATPLAPGTWAAGACVGAKATELLVQKVVITVRSPHGKVTRTLEVLKSDI